MIARRICCNLRNPCDHIAHNSTQILHGSAIVKYIIVHSICENLWNPCADYCAQIYTDLHDSVRTVRLITQRS